MATWSAPPTDFGAIETASRPDTGSDGHFFTENTVSFDMTTQGQTSWLDSHPLAPPKAAGTYVGYVRVSGWDPQAHFVDYGYGITDWLGDYIFSPVQQFTLIAVQHRVLVTRGHFVKRGKRRVWVRPVYRTTYSWADS
jgi:hypothetical protein